MALRSARYAMVTAAAVCGQIAAGIILMGLSIFTDPIIADLWPDGSRSRATVQTYFTVLMVTSMCVMPIAGRVIGRIGARKLLLTGGVVATLGLAGMSLAQGLPSLYLASVVVGAGFGVSVNFVPVVLVNAWFEKRRGPITGLVLAGTGLGGILNAFVFPAAVPPVDAGGIGWRSAMLLAAGIFAAFAVLPAIFLVTNKPSDVGLPVYGLAMVGDPAATSEQVSRARHRKVGLRQAEALRTPWFWVLYAAITVLGIYYAMGQIINPFLTNQQTDPGSGVTPGVVAIYMTAQSVGLILAKPLVGALWEAIGLYRTMAIVMFVHAIAGWQLGELRFPASGGGLVVLALVGMGFAIGTVTPPLVCAIAFGQRDYSAIWGVLATAFWLGTATGAVIWSAAGTIGADPGQPWQLYRFAMKWCWVLGLFGLAGYAVAIRGGRAAQRLHQPDAELAPANL